MSEMADSTQTAAVAPRPGKRQRLVAAAVQLLHQQGVQRTTLADIAQAAEVPPGNVYYYFKTKDEVVTAAIDAHLQQIRGALADIDARFDSPRSRLKALVDLFTADSETVTQYGCPIGTLCSELDKRPAHEAFPVADLIHLPIAWAETQFRALGRADAHDLALQLMAAYEGSALLSNTLRDPTILTTAARRLTHWLTTI